MRLMGIAFALAGPLYLATPLAEPEALPATNLPGAVAVSPSGHVGAFAMRARIATVSTKVSAVPSVVVRRSAGFALTTVSIHPPAPQR